MIQVLSCLLCAFTYMTNSISELFSPLEQKAGSLEPRRPCPLVITLRPNIDVCKQMYIPKSQYRIVTIKSYLKPKGFSIK